MVRKPTYNKVSYTVSKMRLSIPIFLIVGTIPLLFAGVQKWVWSFYGLSMLFSFITILWQGKLARPKRGAVNVYGIAIALFFVSTVLACLPVPETVLAQVSATRYGILSSAWNLIGNSPSGQTLSYMSEKSLAWWVFLVCLGVFFITLKNVLNDVQALKRLTIIIMCVALFEAIYGLLQALVPSMGVLWVDYIEAGMG